MSKSAIGRNKSKKKKTPYSQASDDEKVARNWKKAIGLFERGEYSVAVLRCGTCMELVVNFAVRQELVTDRGLPLQFVDSLLKNANGLRNKYQNIFLPIMAEYEQHDDLKNLWKTHIEEINKHRNAIAHSGEFRSRPIAEKVMTETYGAITHIMKLYERGNDLQSFQA